MKANPISVRPDQPLAAARRIMHSLGVRHLLVMDRRRVVGMLREADLRLLDSFQDLDPASVTVEDTMGFHPCIVSADEPLDGVLTAMLARQMDAVLVVDSDRLLGMFTAMDAVAVLRRLVTCEAEETS